MAEGTNVGNIYVDLIVRNTVGKQIQEIAAQGQKTAQQAFSGIEKTAEAAVNKVTSQAGKVAQKTAEAAAQAVQKTSEDVARASQTAAAPLGKAFSKPVEMAKAKLKQLEDEFSQLSIRAEEVMRKDTSFQMYGYVSDGNKEFWRLDAQSEKVYRKVEAARDRLAIEVQAAAQKQAEAEERAARRAAAAAERASASAARAAARREREEKRAAIAAEKAAQKAAAAEEKAANRRKGILASFWKNMLANANDSTRKISGKITGLIKNFTTANKTTKRFVSRLREIATGALFFNGISAALRSMTEYMGEALSVSEEMRSAWANLKGAAANAASPLIQALTPALVTLANAAAVALTYVERLVTWITGKTSNAAETASKIAEKNAKKAQRYLASFDQLNRLDKKDEEKDDEIKPNYNFKGFNPFLESLLNAIKAGQWTRVGELIAEKLNETLAAIPWDTILQKAKQWTQNFVDVLNGFIHKVDWGLIGVTLGQGLNTLLTIIDTFFQGIDWKALGAGLAIGLSNMIATVDWAMLGRVLTDRLKALLETLYGFVTNFDFSALGTALAQLLNAAFDNIDWGLLWETIKAGIAGLFEGICAFFAELEPDTLGAIIGWMLISAFTAATKLAWLGVKEALIKVTADLVQVIIGKAGIGAWGAKILAAGKTLISTLVGKIGTIATKILPAALTSLGNILSGLVAAIGGWPTVLIAAGAAAIAALVVWIKNGGHEVVQGFIDGLKEKWAELQKWWDELWNSLATEFKEFWDIHSPSKRMEKMGGYLVDGLDRGISKNWDKVTDTVGDGSEEVEEEVSDKWEKLFNKTEKAWTAMVVMTNKLFQKIESSIQKHTSSAEKSATSSANSIATETNQSWSQMNSNATSAFNRLSSKITSAWTNLRSSMSSISWNNVGTNMVAGLNNGITSAWGRLMTNVRNLANQLTAAVNGAFKIHSPSKVFYAIGQYLDAGLENGILDGRRRLLGTVGSIAAAVTDSMKIQIPSVIKQPALAMVNASTNAQQGGLSAFSSPADDSENLSDYLLSILRELQALTRSARNDVNNRSGDIRIFIGSREVFQAVVDENNRTILRTGSSPLKG